MNLSLLFIPLLADQFTWTAHAAFCPRPGS